MKRIQWVTVKEFNWYSDNQLFEVKVFFFELKFCNFVRRKLKRLFSEWIEIPNILIIAVSSLTTKKSKKYDLITHQFTTRYNQTNVIYLDTFDCESKIFSMNANLFPYKLKNLNGREIRLALFNYKPYTLYKKVVLENIVICCALNSYFSISSHLEVVILVQLTTIEIIHCKSMAPNALYS